MKNKVRAFLDNPKKVNAVVNVALMGGTLVVYTLVCKSMGFRMVRPIGNDEDFFRVETIHGSILRSPLDK